MLACGHTLSVLLRCRSVLALSPMVQRPVYQYPGERVMCPDNDENISCPYSEESPRWDTDPRVRRDKRGSRQIYGGAYILPSSYLWLLYTMA